MIRHVGRAFVVAGGVLAAVAFLAPGAAPAFALQDYARQESKDCAFCHVSARGGGPRNEKGREYEANGHRFGVESWSSEANRKDWLRASSALVATWYAEADRILTALDKSEKLPGGRALVASARERYSMFPRTWLRAAKTLLAKGERGRPNAMAFFAKLESQFPATDEGREAVKLLDEAVAGSEKDAAAARDASAARAQEKVRGVVLRGRTEWDAGELDAARKLLNGVLADPLGTPYEPEIRELLATIPAK